MTKSGRTIFSRIFTDSRDTVSSSIKTLLPETDGNRLKKLVKAHITHGLDHVPSKEERLSYDKIVTVTERGVSDAFRTKLDNQYGQFLVKTLGNLWE